MLPIMTKLLEQALEAARRLPTDAQNEIARAMLALAGDDGEPEPIDPAHLPDVLESLAQAKRRQFATDAEVEATFRRFTTNEASVDGCARLRISPPLPTTFVSEIPPLRSA
jgi:hypothetical protein